MMHKILNNLVHIQDNLIPSLIMHDSVKIIAVVIHAVATYQLGCIAMPQILAIKIWNHLSLRKPLV